MVLVLFSVVVLVMVVVQALSTVMCPLLVLVLLRLLHGLCLSVSV